MNLQFQKQFRALDLFCKAGGATRGLQNTGFHVTGVDIEPQKNYCGDVFFRANALDFDLSGFDFVWASPPCQVNLKGLNAANIARGRKLDHQDLIAPIRERIRALNIPYIIENVEGSNLINPVRLCGSSFNLPIRRHRLFESNLLLFVPPCNHSWQNEAKYPTNFRPNGKKILSTVVQIYGNTAGSHLWAGALGIDWMNRYELQQSIPPAYSEYLGKQIITALKQSFHFSRCDST
ncbi:MAG TPA: hypothetical protein VGD05_02295 [Pyrinomonadaceae bacterium]|jgi:DNA (cytosine-5)-methyltransferase 1